MKEKQEAQAVVWSLLHYNKTVDTIQDIQTLQERGEAQEKTGTGLEEKVQSWKNDAENVHQDLKSLIALRERAYLTDVLKQASKAEINTIFAQQAESNGTLFSKFRIFSMPSRIIHSDSFRKVD